MNPPRLPDGLVYIRCNAFRTLTYFVKQHHKTLLDIGIGNGDKLLYWHTKGLLVGGCDNDEAKLEDARDKRFRVEHVDLNDTSTPLPYDDDSFDVVTCVHVLEHVKDPKWVVEEAMRISKDLVLLNVPKQRSYFSPEHIHFWEDGPEFAEAVCKAGYLYFIEAVISKDEDVRKTVRDRLRPENTGVYYYDQGFLMVIYKKLSKL